jgi:hypothetical protein
MDERKRRILSPTEQKTAVDIMIRFKDVHEEIAELERMMSELDQEQKRLIAELDNVRIDDMFFQSMLSGNYGPGFLDASKLEWVNYEEEKI